MKQVKKAFVYRIYPNDLQKEMFAKTFGCARKIWNLMLDDRINSYKQYHEDATPIKETTPAMYKKDYPYLKEVDSLALANEQMHLRRAFTNFYRNSKTVGYPKFKSKNRNRNSYTTNNQNGTIAIIDKQGIKLPKVGVVSMDYHREHTGKIKSATVSQDATGAYYVAILCETEVEAFAKTNSSIGVDMGIHHYVVLSDGTKIENPKYLKKDMQRLQKLQRKLSRKAEIAKAKGIKLEDAKNYQKLKITIARLHKRIYNRRHDFLHKLSTYLIKNHDVICVEKLSVKKMLESHLAQAITDAGWTKFLALLKYKAEWYGKSIKEVEPYYPSTQICHVCGSKESKKALHIREWECSSCHSYHDRDINAAMNIHQHGLAI
ncbi:putative transposase [Breznakia blatticola]|uniref:Putative transposase n=1 Tax=Breznakia blatticola TaxID=1754012 RepID=A0A4R8A315_9FIRM|nr:IS200/IS605 family element RNA-guided endonuclease TnpB [Breznakia blatticola]TDW24862.1 putative transposase [Breznakia blatticola]